MNVLNRILRRSLLSLAAVAAVATAGSGCTHYANVAQVDAADGIPTYVSSRTWSDGTPRTVIVERVLDTGDTCELLEVKSHYFARDGLLAQRAVEMMRCGVVERSTVDDFDVATGQHVRVVREDVDHDGEFDHERTSQRAVSMADLERMSDAVL